MLENGDRVTCEIRRLARGKLQVKTDDMGTLDIEWDEVATVTAAGLFEIGDRSGRLYHGPLETIAGRGLRVTTATGPGTVPLSSVVRITMIREGFWQRLSGSVDLGFSYTKASELGQLNADASLKFTRPTFSAELAGSSLVQRQPGTDDTTRHSLSFTYIRTLGGQRFALGRASAEQNRELGFELRTALAGALGRYLLRNQGNEILGAGGLYVNREAPVEGETTTNLEAVVALDWANFSYDFPNTDIEITWALFLGLTDWGRYRVDLEARFDRELFGDFHLILKGYYSYDSAPPTGGASTDDYQISLAIGYAF